MPESEAVLYEMPFEYLRQNVYAKRSENNREGLVKGEQTHREECGSLEMVQTARTAYKLPSSVDRVPRIVLWGRHSARSGPDWLRSPSMPSLFCASRAGGKESD
jgi:hypothetical protein